MKKNQAVKTGMMMFNHNLKLGSYARVLLTHTEGINVPVGSKLNMHMEWIDMVQNTDFQQPTYCKTWLKCVRA